MKKLFFICSILLILLSVPLAGFCASPVKAKSAVPTSIKAEHMEYNADGQTVVFKGNVYVKRPDFELWSTKLTVYLKKSAKKEPQEESKTVGGMEAGDIDRIVAEGNVRMKNEDKTGQCEKATYYAASDKFVMEGSPVLKEKENVIRGETIVHYMDENRSEVLGGKKGVEATFYAPDKTENGLSPTNAIKGKGK